MAHPDGRGYSKPGAGRHWRETEKTPFPKKKRNYFFYPTFCVFDPKIYCSTNKTFNLNNINFNDPQHSSYQKTVIGGRTCMPFFHSARTNRGRARLVKGLFRNGFRWLSEFCHSYYRD